LKKKKSKRKALPQRTQGTRGGNETQARTPKFAIVGGFQTRFASHSDFASFAKPLRPLR
jgi:hypothetical protein